MLHLPSTYPQPIHQRITRLPLSKPILSSFPQSAYPMTRHSPDPQSPFYKPPFLFLPLQTNPLCSLSTHATMDPALALTIFLTAILILTIFLTSIYIILTLMRTPPPSPSSSPSPPQSPSPREPPSRDSHYDADTESVSSNNDGRNADRSGRQRGGFAGWYDWMMRRGIVRRDGHGDGPDSDDDETRRLNGEQLSSGGTGNEQGGSRTPQRVYVSRFREEVGEGE
ncbi:hypothetical protein M011DRAFT_171746 [Sporormia fimetaria CBS 119925]|uniref:Uncharacterized protein n=1 Tax=Sporormia fimetaria CBS 119925 TaxID=1340428 RepID=A0A6A6V4A0_9PLEO|nr:hypothetical protein M011DRAFT_171746 [Sporormia fimetaria CBS 119925]